ncbi:hypothetical protein [Anabaena azotica]|uniref:hypothetical protein n=1 Tax=Anabaena azotica TaxID=197653 RepID=UPI0039A62F7C
MSNLFTAVSIEQQEIVAGGFGHDDDDDGFGGAGYNSKYENDSTKLLKIEDLSASNGRHGSTLKIGSLLKLRKSSQYSKVAAWFI